MLTFQRHEISFLKTPNSEILYPKNKQIISLGKKKENGKGTLILSNVLTSFLSKGQILVLGRGERERER